MSMTRRTFFSLFLAPFLKPKPVPKPTIVTVTMPAWYCAQYLAALINKSVRKQGGRL